jgi:hypothetical protein
LCIPEEDFHTVRQAAHQQLINEAFFWVDHLHISPCDLISAQSAWAMQA